MRGLKRFMLFSVLLVSLTCSDRIPTGPFPILAWYGPPRAMTNLDAFRQMRKAGFTINYSNYSDPQFNLQALDLAQKSGLKLLLSDQRIENIRTGKDSIFTHLDSVIADYSHHPAFWGYFLQDEPRAANFERLAVIKRYMAKKDSLHPVYINLFPNYATPAQLGTETYREYVNRFIAIVEPDLLSFDFYPILDYGLREGYYQNLELIREVALKNGIPFWAFTLSVPHASYPKPEHSHLRLQLYSALAYGAGGLQYFTYATPKSRQWNFHDAILNADGQTTDTYRYATLINGEIQKLAPVLLRLKSTGVCHSLPVPPGCSPLQPGLPVVKIDGQNILAGFFTDAHHHNFVMFVNKNYKHGAMPRIYFRHSVKRLEEIQKNENRPLVIKWNGSDPEKSTEIIFKAGDGRLFKIVE